jgi:RNA polymerase sigma-70 factor (ECF subfamily)
VFEEQLLQQRSKIISYIRARVDDPDLSEDVFQDSLLKVLQHAGDLHDAERLVPWFYRIVNNAIADYYRQKGLAARYQPRLALEAELNAEPDERAALCACFQDLLPTLKPEYAALIRRLDLDEAEPKQVAGALGLTRNNLKVRHHRARQALRQRLEETCRMCAEHGCLDCTCQLPAARGASP